MDIYGIVGNPLAQSFSPRFFNEKFKMENINAEYLKFEIADISLFPKIISSNPNLKGLNVTIPYKEKIIPFIDELEPQAKEIGAINVIKVSNKGGKTKLIGFNSDLVGFQNSISPLINKTIHKRALILGTGGASKAVAKGLENLNIIYKFVSRTPQEGQVSYDELNKNIFDQYTIIVNASPIGTYPKVEEAPSIPYQYINHNHLLYDLVYNPAETMFLNLGKKQGATIKNGAEMLKLQALAAWEIWNM